MKIITLIFFTLFVFSTICFSQTGSSENQACNPEFAKLLVEQQVSESRSVEETDKRIKILIRAADFLWKFDEPTARKYFTEAFNVAGERYREFGFEQRKTGKDVRSITMRLPDYRIEVIRAIAKKDGEWAMKLSEEVLKEYEKRLDENPSDHLDKTKEINELMAVALENLQINPALSRYIFRRLMQYPLDSHWYFALYQVAGKDQSFAEQLYGELLQRYAGETPRRLLFLSAYPFINERIFGIDKFQFGMDFDKSIQPNPRLQRQFLDIFFRRIAIFANTPDDINRPPEKYRQPEAVYIASALQEIEPIVMQKFPELLERLNQAKAQANTLMTEDVKKTLQERSKQNSQINTSFEERLKAVEKAESEGRLTDFLIYQLISWGERTEEEFKLIEPWLDKMQDENIRRETTNYFYFKRAELAISEKRYDDAKKFAGKVPELDHRAILLFKIGKAQMESEAEAANVFQTLNEISKNAREAENSAAKAQVLLGLAHGYEKVNHSVALNELSEAVRVINELENPDIFTTSIHRQIIGKDFAFYAVFNSPRYNLETTFEEISKNDFELSLAHAKSLNDKYFKTLAVLAVAKNCVENAEKKKIKK